MIQCVYKIIQATDKEIEAIHLCYRKNHWIHVSWRGSNVFKQKFKYCPICGNTDIKEVKEEH